MRAQVYGEKKEFLCTSIIWNTLLIFFRFGTFSIARDLSVPGWFFVFFFYGGEKINGIPSSSGKRRRRYVADFFIVVVVMIIYLVYMI